MTRRTISVSGMACSGCEETVEQALRGLGNVTRVEADHETDTVDVVAEDDVTDEALAEAIHAAGYDVEA